MNTFEERHAQIDTDPLKELIRRRQSWASAPDSRGRALDAQIIPRSTLDAAIRELSLSRSTHPVRSLWARFRAYLGEPW
jgi:hypothetical protein